MDWMTKIEIARQWQFMSETKQQAALKSYLMTHPVWAILGRWRLVSGL